MSSFCMLQVYWNVTLSHLVKPGRGVGGGGMVPLRCHIRLGSRGDRPRGQHEDARHWEIRLAPKGKAWHK